MLSVCLSHGPSWLYCANQQIKMLFGVNTPGGPWNIVLHVGLDPPTDGRGPVFNFGTLLLFLEQLKLDLKFCMHTEDGGLTRTMQKYVIGGWGGVMRPPF